MNIKFLFIYYTGKNKRVNLFNNFKKKKQFISYRMYIQNFKKHGVETFKSV